MIRLPDLNAITSNESLSADERRISVALAAAMNDWPTPNLDSIDDFVSELKLEIGTLTKVNIRNRLNGYSFDADAWKSEALTELLDAWGDDIANDHVLLDDLIERIKTTMTL